MPFDPMAVGGEVVKALLTGLFGFIGATLGVSFRARKAESGRLHAREQDLKLVLAEARAQKELETNISGAEWGRQWLIEQKRQVYLALIERLEEIKAANKELLQVRRGGSQEKQVEEGYVAELRRAVIGFQQARSSARLIANPECLEAIHNVAIPIRLLLTNESDAERCYESVRLVVRAARVAMTAAARKDLGMRPYQEPEDGQ